MFGSAKLRAKGQITLPKRVREAINAKPRDSVHITVTGPETLELRIFRPMTLAEMIERYGSNEPYDNDAIREAWQEDAWRDVIGE
jgi:AbrB family looped-hinge helix DNA binding protein